METITQNETETTIKETRLEIKLRHAAMLQRHDEAMEFLETLRTGRSFYTFQGETGVSAIFVEAKKAKAAEAIQDEGLTTEINTSKSCVSLRDTIEGVADLLRRHPHGYRAPEGKVYTEEENREAAEWATKVPNKPGVIIPEKIRPISPLIGYMMQDSARRGRMI